MRIILKLPKVSVGHFIHAQDNKGIEQIRSLEQTDRKDSAHLRCWISAPKWENKSGYINYRHFVPLVMLLHINFWFSVRSQLSRCEEMLSFTSSMAFKHARRISSFSFWHYIRLCWSKSSSMFLHKQNLCLNPFHWKNKKFEWHFGAGKMMQD